MTTIAERILDAFPSGNYGLLALMRLLDIEETAEVETAAVECAVSPRLKINPAFVETFANTPEKLLMLVLHELHHVLLGHTRMFRRATSIDNLAFDAVINALLCRMFPAGDHTAFFTEFYADNEFPACLLRPPRGWRPGAPAGIPPALETPELAGVRPVYQALYSRTGADYSELLEVLKAVSEEPGIASVPLLGDHETDGASVVLDPTGLVFEAVRAIVERWPLPPNPVRGRSWADVLKQASVQPRRISRNRAILRKLLTRIAAAGNAATLRRRSLCPTGILTPLPVFDRRTLVLRALGADPLLHRAALPIVQRTSRGSQVHVYLDVSGSIGDLKDALYGAVLDAGELVHRTVHLFSTEVRDVTLQGLRKGECHTTYGTDIHCVAAHMRANRIGRAVLLTDGLVGRPSTPDAETLTRAVLGVALTPGCSSRHDLEKTNPTWVQLENER